MLKNKHVNCLLYTHTGDEFDSKLEANAEARLEEMGSPGSHYEYRSSMVIITVKIGSFEWCRVAFDYKGPGNGPASVSVTAADFTACYDLL